MEAERNRILIVDDEPETCTRMADLLSPAGYEVVCISNGVDARVLISQQQFDVIVSGIRLRGLDGLELLRTVRRRDPSLPVVLVSDAPDPDSAMEAIRFGAVWYLDKPVAPEEFRGMVKRALELQRPVGSERRLRPPTRGSADASLESNFQYSAFKSALESVWMAFQPIVSVVQGSTIAYEALVRSNDERFPDPGTLLDAAERLDRMFQLGRKIRERVAADIPTLRPQELVFVNVHPLELDDEQLYSIQDPLSRHADRVVLEITERSRLDGVHNLAERLRRLCDMGYRIALDDLGAGYASLSSLMQLNPHFVKLDMSLTRDIHLHAVKQKLARSMLQVCRELGVSVVSEGVENADEGAMLTQLGGDLMQGYHFGRPEPRIPIVQPVRSLETARQP